MERLPKLSTGREWFALRHQAGGGSCELYKFVGTKVPLTSSLHNKVRQIARDRYPGGRAGWDGFHVSAGELAADKEAINIYRSELAALDLGYSGQWLTESIYPLDVTEQNVFRLSDGQLVRDDFGLVDADEVADTEVLFLIVTENSD